MRDTIVAAPSLPLEEELHWLALALVPGLGARNAMKLIQRFRTPMAVFRASRSELEAAGVCASLAQSIASGCVFEDAAEQQERMKCAGIAGIALGHPLYPPRLKEIFDPPVFLYARGRLELLASVSVAVVGTRRPTAYGVAVAERLAADLATAGVTIVSGMARGIDTAAHRGCLNSGGGTIAVFGCGIDVIYPVENRKLAEEIAQRGLLISEFPLGCPGYPQNFPIRNRIVSGLSAGVVVVEGAQYSGSAITAKLALDQGREVFAVPGNITSKASWGPNLLIKQGAKLVQDWYDIVAELSEDDRLRLSKNARAKLGLDATTKIEESPADSLQTSLSLDPGAPLRQKIMGILPHDEPWHVDELLERVENYSSSELLAALFELELAGLVRQMPGKRYVKVW